MSNLFFCIIGFFVEFFNLNADNIFYPNIEKSDFKFENETTFKSLNNFLAERNSYTAFQIHTTPNFIFANFKTSSVIGYNIKDLMLINLKKINHQALNNFLANTKVRFIMLN